MGTDIYIYMFGRLLYSCSCALDCIGIILWDIVLYMCCKVITVDHYFQKKGDVAWASGRRTLLYCSHENSDGCWSIHPGRHLFIRLSTTGPAAFSVDTDSARIKPVCSHACKYCACSYKQCVLVIIKACYPPPVSHEVSVLLLSLCDIIILNRS